MVDGVSTEPTQLAASGDRPPASREVLRSLGIDVLLDIIEKSSYGVCITGDEHTWLYLNPAGARFFGKPFEELYGHDYLLSFAPHERDALLALEMDQRDGDTGFYANTVVRPDGSEHEMTWSGSVVQTSNGEVAPAIFHDTSRIRRAQREAAALAAAAAQLAAGGDTRGIMGALVNAAVATTRAIACVVMAASDALAGDGVAQLRAVAHSGGVDGLGAAVAAAVDRLALPLAAFPEGELLSGGRRPLILADHRSRLLADPVTAPLVPVVDERWEGSALVPLRTDGRLVGVLMALLPPEVTSPSEEEIEFWASLADQAGAALTAARLRGQAEATAAAAERLRIGRELHDSVSHALFALRQRGELIEKALDSDNEALLRAAAAGLKDVAQQAITDMRALLAELRPAAPDAPDLVGAVRRSAAEVTARHGLEVELQVTPPAEERAAALDHQTCEHLARLVGEALHNTVKHADASRASISLTVTADQELVLVVRDDGRGWTPTGRLHDPGDRHRGSGHAAGGGHGLRTMRERMALCGGSLTVTSAPGAGTEVAARLPLRPGR